MTIPSVSFEFFPPGDEAMAEKLWQSIQRLAPLQPRFVSVTYGADGSTRTRTHECVLRILRETHLRVAPHLTCVGASRAEVLRIAQGYWDLGLRHLVALRGDPPAANLAGGRYRPQEDGFAYASDLVAGLAQVGNFEVSVAAYPEGHPESGGVDAGSSELEAQGRRRRESRDHPVLLRDGCVPALSRSCAAAGIRASIVPGILPVTRFPQMLRFAARCGASVPDWLRAQFDGLDDDPETRSMIAANVAIEQVQRLRRHGVEEFHFYTLNRAELSYAICHALGIRPRSCEEKVA